MSYSTGVAAGTHFGYPESFGNAYVTYRNDAIVQLEFKNGVVENRTHKDVSCTREIHNPDGTKTVIND